MTADIYAGELVRLVPVDIESSAEAFERWCQDSEYMRLSGCEPSYMWTAKQEKEWIEKSIDEGVVFSIVSLEDQKVIGDIELDDFDIATGNAWLGIGIGERDFWGKGYGTDAMRVILRFGFEQLNLRRISLNVFEYNPRAIHCYEKVGFQIEGRARQWMKRDGKRADLIYMGILRSEWEAMQVSG
jgi:RimJ/RimL family protein N-acetyltransferase